MMFRPRAIKIQIMISAIEESENHALKNRCTELGALGSTNWLSRKITATTEVKPIAHFLLLLTAV
jgi:hypothetical protein